MGAILPLHVLRIDQPQIGLIDQGSGSQRVTRPFPRHVALRQTVQFLRDERREFLQCRLIPITPIHKDLRDFPLGMRRHTIRGMRRFSRAHLIISKARSKKILPQVLVLSDCDCAYELRARKYFKRVDELEEVTMVFRGKHALITGSSRGIGRGIELKLAERGVNIAIHYYKQEEAANETLAKMRARPAGAPAVGSRG